MPTANSSLLKTVAAKLHPGFAPRRNFQGGEEREEGDKGCTNLVQVVPEQPWLEKASSPCSCPAWEPPGPWAPAQRRRKSSHYSLPATRLTNPVLLPALTKCHVPLLTWKWPFACMPPSCGFVFLVMGETQSSKGCMPLEGVRASGWLSWAMGPPNPARRTGPQQPRGGLQDATLAQGVPLQGWAVQTQERMLPAAHSPTFPLFSPWVMNSPIISAVIQGWAKFLCLAAMGCIAHCSPARPAKFLASL